MIKKTLFMFVLLMVLPSLVSADYYVSPSGSGSSCTLGSPCALSYANGQVGPGETVYLMDGTYNTLISPSNSGTSASNRIIYQAYPGETPTITTPSSRGFSIRGNKDYIKIDGITFQNCQAWGEIADGSDYNEISNCKFDSSTYVNGNKGLYVWNGGGSSSTHNWIHDSTFSRNTMNTGCGDEGGHLWFGVWPNSFTDHYNTAENNVFSSGGHHLLETHSKYNVIRNNVFHNEGWESIGGCDWGPSPRNGLYGNRLISIYDGNNAGAMHNLIESNRLGHSAFASDGGMDGNLVLTSHENIARYNDIYYSETWGIYFKAGTNSVGADNRVYSNTVFASGQDSQIYPNAWTGYGDMDWRKGIGDQCSGSICTNNVIKNNIVYNSYTADFSFKSSMVATNNWCTNPGSGCTGSGDPDFVDTYVGDPTSLTRPDLSLQQSSGARDGGTYLTQANGARSSSTNLVVDDASYFQDGWGSSLSDIQPDWIAIGAVSDVVQISSISGNTITLSSPMTWSDNAPVWLYKDSTGRRVLYGSAPEYGAHEFVESSQSPILYETNFDSLPDWHSQPAKFSGLQTTHSDARQIGFTSYRVGVDDMGSPLFEVNSQGCQNGKCLKVNCEGDPSLIWTGGGVDLHFSDSDTFPAWVDGNGYDELYVRFLQKFDNGWDWGGGNAYVKLMRAYSKVDYDWHWSNNYMLSSADVVSPGSGTGCKSGYMILDWGGGDYNFLPAFREEPSCSTSADQDYGCTWSDHFADGQWHHVEMHIRMNDIGTSNAIEEIFVDGNRCGGYVYENPLIRQTSDRKFNSLNLFDNVNIGYPGEQTYYIDDLVVSTEYVGPDYVVGDPTCTDPDGDGYGSGIACSGTDCAEGNPSLHTPIPCSYDGNSCGQFDLCVSSCPATGTRTVTGCPIARIRTAPGTRYAVLRVTLFSGSRWTRT
jgi:hypothetical protein